MVDAVPVDVRRWVGRRPDPDSAVACCAPFVTMEFGAYGTVQACCANALYPIGDVRYQTLAEIWRGPRAAHLRSALRAGDLSNGCGVCRHRLLGEFGELPRDYYDQFDFRGGDDPSWPKILTFSLHNTCNLACIMCGGDESSRIRTQRDGLPPLTPAYGDRFFDQLGPFLQHCDFADFVGGEPFLVQAHRRVWEMLIAQEHRVRCSATTNGTIWNKHVETALDALDFQITVSVDGLTRSTFESIRVGASHREVFKNIERFRAYTAERGTGFSLSWSLVRQNWSELGAMLRWSEERGIPVKVQTVLEPEFGVQEAPTDELRTIVDALTDEDTRLRSELDLNAAVWVHELNRLRGELYRREQKVGSAPGTTSVRALRGPLPDNAMHIEQRLSGFDADSAGTADCSIAHPDLSAWTDDDRPPTRFLVDSDGELTNGPDLALLLPPRVVATVAATIGTRTTLSELLRRAAEPFGGGIWIIEEFEDADHVELLVLLGRQFRDKSGLILRVFATRRDGLTDVTMASSWTLLDETFLPPRAEPHRTTPVRILRRLVGR